MFFNREQHIFELGQSRHDSILPAFWIAAEAVYDVVVQDEAQPLLRKCVVPRQWAVRALLSIGAALMLPLDLIQHLGLGEQALPL